jgi:hypothetical protein
MSNYYEKLSQKEIGIRPRLGNEVGEVKARGNGSMVVNHKQDHLRIVFVDDSEEARLAFCMVFKKKGAEIKAAGSAQEDQGIAVRVIKPSARYCLVGQCGC